MTLTGFDNREKTPDEWRAYIEGLRREIAAVKTRFETQKAERQLTFDERRKLTSRIDLLSEFVMRAEWELE